MRIKWVRLWRKKRRKSHTACRIWMNQAKMEEWKWMKFIVLGKFSLYNRRCAEPNQQSTRRFALSNHSLVLRQHLTASLELVVLDQHRRLSLLSHYNNDLLRGFVRVVLHVSTAFCWNHRCWLWPTFLFHCCLSSSVVQAEMLAIDPLWMLP